MKKKLIILLSLIMVLLLALAMTGCASPGSSSDQTDNQESAAGIDYMVLVNKLHPLPAGWEDALETETTVNSVGDEVEVEAKAYEQYLLLKEDLEKNNGIYLELDSARRTIAAQQKIMDDFTEKYGEDYAKKTVATPGYSEHHTGLALDLYFKIKGDDGQFTDVYENEDLVQYPEIWDQIHEKLADYGFILRYLEDREHITGYSYEPWHIRYIDDPETAKKITDEDITFEEYLGDYRAPEVQIDYGTSDLYTKDELEEAAVRIKCEFATMEGCELHSLRYAGDECNTEENIKWLDSLSDGANYTKICEFLCDFHSPEKGGGAWEADKEYEDYQWWLGFNEDGSWDIVSQGYR